MTEDTISSSNTGSGDTSRAEQPLVVTGTSSASQSQDQLNTTYAYKENTRPELSPKPFDKRPLLYGVLVAAGFFIAALLLAIWLYNNPTKAEIIRDIFLIYIGLGIFVLIPLVMILTVILIYLALKLNDLTLMVHREVIPMLTNIQTTLNNVKGTTTFLSDQAVKPVITTASSIAAVRGIVRSLFKR